MSNSSLVEYTKISPHRRDRTAKIDKITIHHAAVVNATLEGFGNGFSGKRVASSNYAIDSNGRVGMYVEEKDRAITSSNTANDNRAVTIEVSNSCGDPDWKVSDKALAKLIDLCVDICQRNGIEKLNFTGDKTGNLTMHKWFASTGCPGPYLESKFPYIAEEVNKRLGEVEPTPEKPAKSIDELAKEVMRGLHGSGEARKKSLGNLYKEVQARVNELLAEKTEETTRYHIVVRGDTLWGIAKKYLGDGGRYSEIVKLNGLQSTVLHVNQRLKIPKK